MAKPLTTDRIVQSLNRLHLEFEVEPDGMCAIAVPPRPGDQTDVRITIEAGGPSGTTLVVRGVAGRSFVPDDWPLLLAAINTWQQRRRWPRGYVHHVTDAPRPFGILVAEHQHPFASGVQNAQLDETLRVAIGASADFLTQVTNAIGAPPPHTLDADLLETWLDD